MNEFKSRKWFLKKYSETTERWLQENSESLAAANVKELYATLTRLQAEKLAMDEKQDAIRGAVGRAKRKAQPVDELIAQMRGSANQLKTLNSSINSTVDALLVVLQGEEENQFEQNISILAPGQFCTPAWEMPLPAQSDHPPQMSEEDKTKVRSTDDPSNDEPATGSASWVIEENISADLWGEYVSVHPEATHYHQYAWREIIQTNFPQECWYAAVIDSAGNIQGLMSLVFMDSPVSGSYLLSMPWLIYGGSLASNAEASEKLADFAKHKMNEVGCTHIELRQVHSRSEWQLMPGKVAMVLALPSTRQQLNCGFDASLRSQIRGATAHAPDIEFGGRELVDDFYSVFCDKMRDLGTPVYHKRFFDSIVTTFVDSVTVVVVRMRGKPVAAAILIKHRDTIEIPWAAARRKANRYAVNMFMYHQILEFSIDTGARYFDFGRSTIDTGTYRFKKQWGAKPFALGWHRWPAVAKDTDSVAEHGMSLKFRAAIAVWKRMPVWLTKIIGPPVARLLPW